MPPAGTGAGQMKCPQSKVVKFGLAVTGGVAPIFALAEHRRGRQLLVVRSHMRRYIAFVVSCTLLPAAWFAVGLDDWLGASLSLNFEACFILLGIVVGTLVMLIGRHKALLFVPSAYILFMLALPFVDQSPVKPAVRAVHEIRPGMSESQVRAILDRHFPEDGRFKRPEIGALHEGVLSFVLDRNDGRYDATGVRVRFSAGKCVSAEFNQD
jgi:hypothetical protein